MKHLGDITKISGYTAPMVDCIIGGSPCQDLSVAGKRAGLDGERSGLFMEQVRITKEMRDRDERNGRTDVNIRPRYLVWENVPGALSSGKPKGEDFRIVLEELAKVADKDAVIPQPPNGKWTSCGCIMGDGWSIAWRVLDAQFWGVPQRRRRIALVADFGGKSAPEVLFVRKGVSGHSQPRREKGQATASDAEGSPVADHREGIGGVIAHTFSNSKRAQNSTDYESWQESDTANTLNAFDTGDVRATEVVVGLDVYNQDLSGDKAITIRCKGDNEHTPCVVYALDRASFNQGKNAQYDFEVSDDGVNSPLVAKGPSAVCYGISSYDSNAMKSSNPNSGIYEAETSRTLDGNGGNPSCNQGGIAVVCVDQGGGKSACNVTEDQAPTLTCTHGGEPAVCYSMGIAMQSSHGINSAFDELMPTLVNGSNPGYQNGVCYWDGGQVAGTLTANNAGGSQRMPDKENFNCVIQGINGDKAGTRGSSYYKGCSMGQGVEREVVYVVQKPRYIVRRLTPCECERLQGFPDRWTDIGDWIDSKGKKHQSSDASRYKALGNSIALPPWKWVLKRLCACYERDATMASLFDGIGGFPYLWEQINGKGSCLWASEIEEFPIAVTKVRIGE